MKLKVIGLALATLFISGGVAAMADTTVVKTQSVGIDYNGAGGTDMAGSGGLREANDRVNIEQVNHKTVVRSHRSHRSVYNNQIDLALPSII